MMERMAAALAAEDGQPVAALDALGRLAQDVTGARLVTLMTSDPATGEAERIWSNMPDPYPVQGRKPMDRTRWSREVLEAKRTFVANDIGAIAEVFPDHPLILSLGCESVVNLPAVVAGEVLGTVNCLAGPGHFTPERVRAAEALRLPAAAVFLFHKTTRGAT